MELSPHRILTLLPTPLRRGACNAARCQGRTLRLRKPNYVCRSLATSPTPNPSPSSPFEPFTTCRVGALLRAEPCAVCLSLRLKLLKPRLDLPHKLRDLAHLDLRRFACRCLSSCVAAATAHLLLEPGDLGIQACTLEVGAAQLQRGDRLAVMRAGGVEAAQLELRQPQVELDVSEPPRVCRKRACLA